MLRTAFYRVVETESTPEILVIRDCGEDMVQPVATVTNDAERVVRQLVAGGLLPPGRRLAYYDSEGDYSELLVAGGQFAGFAQLAKGGAS